MGRLRFRWIRWRIAPIGAAAVLLASGCSLLPAVLGTPTFQAATLAAADAWSFTDVTVRPSVQQALYARDVLNLYADQTAPGGSLNQLPTPSGRTVDFEKDVLPHLDGEVAYVLSGPLDQMQGVLLVHTNDVEGVLRLLADDRAPKFTKDARGATRWTNGDVLAAGYKNWVVYTNADSLLTQTLDRIDGKGGPNLAAQPRYQSVVQRLSGDHLGYGYLDLIPLLENPALRDLQPGSSQSARGRLAYSLAFGAGPEGGMRALDLRTEFIAEGPPPPLPADRGDALQAMDRLPVGNAVAFAGSSMGQLAQSLDSLSADVVPDDVLTLVHAFTGPYAIGVSPWSGAGTDSSSFLGSLFFLGQLTPDADTDTIQELVTSNVGDGGDWQSQVVTDGDWTAVNVVPAAVDLDQMPQEVLASDRLYQSIRPALTQDGTNAFVNVGALVAWGRDQGATSEELAAVGPIRAIGTSWRSEAKGDGHGRTLVVLGS
ncbi:MAG TPA: DUF3352 domain-containing protein [Chloroflexota bacterium]|nr:DUF3352 domain-containing protein [Chloroflexota bacterium]